MLCLSSARCYIDGALGACSTVNERSLSPIMFFEDFYQRSFWSDVSDRLLWWRYCLPNYAIIFGRWSLATKFCGTWYGAVRFGYCWISFLVYTNLAETKFWCWWCWWCQCHRNQSVVLLMRAAVAYQYSEAQRQQCTMQQAQRAGRNLVEHTCFGRTKCCGNFFLCGGNKMTLRVLDVAEFLCHRWYDVGRFGTCRINGFCFYLGLISTRGVVAVAVCLVRESERRRATPRGQSDTFLILPLRGHCQIAEKARRVSIRRMQNLLMS